MSGVGDPARTYSTRLGRIDSAQLQQACDLFDVGTLEAAEPASAGVWGQNILLTTSRGAFVLRGNPIVPHQLRKERVVAEAINDRCSLPVAWPYLVSENTEPFGWSFAIMPMLPGTTGSQLWESAEGPGRVALAEAHGEALACLHEAEFASPGPYDPEQDTFTTVDHYATWTLERVGSLRSRCRAIDALTPESERYIDGLIDSCADALTEPVPVLVHHDFSLGNTAYEPHGDRYRARGVFDLGEAHIGDGEEDLVRFLFRRKRAEREVFMAAYTVRHPLRPDAGDRLALYTLADLLFMWEVSTRVTGWFGDSSFVDVVTPAIDAVRRAACGPGVRLR